MKNIVVIKSVRYAFGKCFFTATIYNVNQGWSIEISENYSIAYYDSPEEYVENNY